MGSTRPRQMNIFNICLFKVAVNVSAKVSTLFHLKVFGVIFEVSKILSARTFDFKGKTNISTLTFDSVSKVTKKGPL